MVIDFPSTRQFECKNCGTVLDHHQVKCEECHSLVGYIPVTTPTEK